MLMAYWFTSAPEYLIGMGVEISKMPQKEAFKEMLLQQIATPLKDKKAYAIIWECNDQAVGHCNINNITFGEEAHMHLHLWNKEKRQKGMGTIFIEKSLPLFFENYELKRLYCEPYAENLAPNKALEKVGFTFEKRYRTVPGSINFEQEVNQWLLTKKHLKVK